MITDRGPAPWPWQQLLSWNQALGSEHRSDQQHPSAPRTHFIPRHCCTPVYRFACAISRLLSAAAPAAYVSMNSSGARVKELQRAVCRFG